MGIMAGYKRVSEDEVSRMIELYESGMNYTQIGIELGRTKSSVGRNLKSLGYEANKNPSHFTQSEIDKMKRLYDQGESMASIGKKIGRGTSSVNMKLIELNVHKIKYTPRQWTKSEVNEASRLYEVEKLNFRQIAEKLGRDNMSVGNKLKALGYKAKKPEYYYSIGEIVGNGTLRIIEKIRVKNGNSTRKGYIVESIAYSDAATYEVNEAHLKSGGGCAYVSGTRVCESNSLWSKVEYRKYIVDEDEAKKITPNSHRKILFRCTCGKEKKMRVYDLLKNGIGCTRCSRGTSFPESMFMAYLETKNVEYETQVIYDDLTDRRFDFRIQLNGVTHLIETHGVLHYKETNGEVWKGAHERTVISDKLKREYCKKNKINLIELDCRKSEFTFIQNSIAENKYLPDINVEDEKAILKFVEKNSRYDVQSIIEDYKNGVSSVEIAKKHNVTYNPIVSLLRKNNIEIRDNTKL